MYRYANLDDNNVVFAVSILHTVVSSEKLILTDDLNVVEGSTYNRTTGEFTPPEPQPVPEPQPTTEEIQTQILLNTECLVVMNELSNL